jgi:1-acylglycerone phosphate reductase
LILLLGFKPLTRYRTGYEVFGTLLPHESRDHLVNTGIHGFTADVTSDEETKRLMAEIEPLCGGRLDVLVNNA